MRSDLNPTNLITAFKSSPNCLQRLINDHNTKTINRGCSIKRVIMNDRWQWSMNLRVRKGKERIRSTIKRIRGLMLSFVTRERDGLKRIRVNQQA